MEAVILSKLAELERCCFDHKLRMTQQRHVLLRVIAEARDHPDIKELHCRARSIDPDISLPTLYRTIRLLKAIGMLQKCDFARGRSRYEVTPKRHHDHLIDVKTGRIIEFRCPEIERLQTQIARRHGYRILDHRLDIYVTPIQPIKKTQD